jgi:WD40 repeat protein
MFAVGSKDGKVRIFNMMKQSPIKTLEGHTQRVYNVLFNKRIPNLLASGSDDKSIRIWDISLLQTTAIMVLGGQGNSSHTLNVRALAFPPEIPWCLVSGSWDGTIKVWDIRSGNCITTITDHNADVYGISFQQSRPFIFASCSRDTTIRHFCIDSLV